MHRLSARNAPLSLCFYFRPGGPPGGGAKQGLTGGTYRDIMCLDITRHIIRGEAAAVADQSPMTEAAYYILLALLKPGHGYGMMQRIRELSGGRLVMGPGTLYGVLSRMNREGLIVLTGEEGRRKNYAITPAGRSALLTEYARLKRMVADGNILEEAER